MGPRIRHVYFLHRYHTLGRIADCPGFRSYRTRIGVPLRAADRYPVGQNALFIVILIQYVEVQLIVLIIVLAHYIFPSTRME